MFLIPLLLSCHFNISVQRENKESRSPRSGAVDLPVVTDSIRNIKSMWEKGNVFASPGSSGGVFKVKGEMADNMEKLTFVCAIGAEREEGARLTGTSCVGPLTMRTSLG